MAESLLIITSEQAIRPFTIARKNFVLMESDHGAKASAMIFSLAETTTANRVTTYEYFELLLSEIPKHMDEGLPSSLTTL